MLGSVKHLSDGEEVFFKLLHELLIHCRILIKHAARRIAHGRCQAMARFDACILLSTYQNDLQEAMLR